MKLTLRRAMEASGYTGFVLRAKLLRKLVGASWRSSVSLVLFVLFYLGGIFWYSTLVPVSSPSLIIFVLTYVCLASWFVLAGACLIDFIIEAERHNKQILLAAMDEADMEVEI